MSFQKFLKENLKENVLTEYFSFYNSMRYDLEDLNKIWGKGNKERCIQMVDDMILKLERAKTEL